MYQRKQPLFYIHIHKCIQPRPNQTKLPDKQNAGAPAWQLSAARVCWDHNTYAEASHMHKQSSTPGQVVNTPSSVKST